MIRRPSGVLLAVDRHVRTAALYTLIFAVLWAVAATARPGTTFHLAPLIVSGIPATALVLDARSARPRGQTGAASLAGFGVAVAVTAALAAASRLEGPSLLPFGGAVTEAVVFSAAGAAGGLLFAFGAQRAR